MKTVSGDRFVAVAIVFKATYIRDLLLASFTKWKEERRRKREREREANYVWGQT